MAAGIYPNLLLASVAGVAVAIAVGGGFGAFNALLVTKFHINSFIATLATAGIGLGAALVLTSGYNVRNIPQDIQLQLGMARFLDLVPYPLILSLVIGLVLWFVLRATRFGMRTLAIGSSREAAIRAGINTDRHLAVLFVMMGALAGVSALLDISRFGTTNISGHQTDALQAIAAVIIGGTSLFGGVASIGGTLLGTLIPVVLATGLVILRIESFYQLIVVGLILLVAVYFDQRRRAAE